MFCIHCGKTVPDEAMFCPSCGKATAVKAAPETNTQQPSAPTPPVAPSALSSEPSEIAKTEPNVTAKAEPVSGPELPDSEHDTAAQYRVTFMRWDTSGPELTIAFSQGDPLVLSGKESRTVLLPGGTQHISLDTASGHSEFEISLKADHKVDLRWNAETGLFSADCKVCEKFQPKESASPASAPVPAAAVPLAQPRHSADGTTASASGKAFSWSYKRSFGGSLRRRISYAVSILDDSLCIVQNDTLPFGKKVLEHKRSVALCDVKELTFQPKASVYFWLICGFLLALLPAMAILWTASMIAPPDTVFGFGVLAFLLGVFNIFFYRFQLHHYRLTLVDLNGNSTKIEAQSSGELEQLGLAVASKISTNVQKKGNPVLTILISTCIGIAVAVGGLLLLFPSGTTSDGDQITGVWKFDHSIIEGTKMTAADLGTDMYIYLSEGGSAEITADYGSVERELGKWELIDAKTLLVTLTSTGEEILFSRAQNTLSASRDGATMYFTRSSISPSQIPASNLAVEADNAQEFTEPPTAQTSVPTPTPDPNSLYIAYDETVKINDFIGYYGGVGNDPPELDDMEALSVLWVDEDTVNFFSGGYREEHFNFYVECADHTGNYLSITDERGDRFAFYYLPAMASPYHQDTIYWTRNPKSDDYWTDYKAYVRDNNTEYSYSSDFAWLEGEYEKAHDVNISMVFDSDDVVASEAYVQFLEYSPNGEVELLGEGPVSYVSGGDETPKFEGYLYNSTMDSVTVEYDGWNFIVNCPALGFFDASFADMF